MEDEERLIQHHLDLGQRSSLTEMKIRIPENFSYDSWLAVIPHLSQLTTLEVNAEGCYQGFSERIYPLMEMLADGCPALEQLTMIRGWPMHLSDLYPMDCHRNLKRIVIDCSELRGDASTFCQRFTNIESLHLRVGGYRLKDIDSLD